MDFQTLVNLAVGVGVPLIGYLLLNLKDLNKDLTDFKVTVATNYATNAELTKIDAKLDRILERMSDRYGS